MLNGQQSAESPAVEAAVWTSVVARTECCSCKIHAIGAQDLQNVKTGELLENLYGHQKLSAPVAAAYQTPGGP